MSIQSPKAQWNDQEVHILLDYLNANKSQGEGARNFKDSTFNGALTIIAPLLSAGPPKTIKHCKTKWASVCDFSPFFDAALIKFLAQNNI